MSILAFTVSSFSHKAKGQNVDYGGYFATLDTMNNADTVNYSADILGKKHNVTFQINVTKISGTVGGKVYIYGSADGTNYATTPLDSIVLTDESKNYQKAWNYNPFKKWKFTIITAGTQSFSQRSYLLYRKE